MHLLMSVLVVQLSHPLQPPGQGLGLGFRVAGRTTQLLNWVVMITQGREAPGRERRPAVLQREHGAVCCRQLARDQHPCMALLAAAHADCRTGGWGVRQRLVMRHSLPCAATPLVDCQGCMIERSVGYGGSSMLTQPSNRLQMFYRAWLQHTYACGPDGAS